GGVRLVGAVGAELADNGAAGAEGLPALADGTVGDDVDAVDDERRLRRVPRRRGIVREELARRRVIVRRVRRRRVEVAENEVRGDVGTRLRDVEFLRGRLERPYGLRGRGPRQRRAAARDE